MGTVTGSGEYEEGQLATLVALPKEGYRFVEWLDGVKDNPRYVTVTGAAAFVAKFEKIPDVEKEYFVTAISANDEMGKVLGGGTYKSGATATLVAIPNTGYKFVRWNDGKTDNPRAVTVNDNLIFVAQFDKEGIDTKPTYTISIASSDESMGTVSNAGQHTVEEGTVFVLTATAKVGHYFVRWEDNSTDLNRVITVTENHNYIAFFAKNPDVVNTYIITVSSANDAQGHTEGSGAYKEGQSVIIKAIAHDGYEFKEWNDGNKEAVRMITITANAKYVASFQEKKTYYTVNVLSANDSQGTVLGAGIYEAGSEISIAAIPAKGYHFDHWNDGNTDNPRTVVVDRDLTFIANFELGDGIYNIEGQDSGVSKVMIDGHVYIITPNGEMYDAVGRKQ